MKWKDTPANGDRPMPDGGLHVLVVEDNAGERWLFSEILRTRGHVVTACEDAESAWEEYQARDPGLVLLDWVLPGVTGLELCRRIRAAPRGDRCVILMITGKDHPDALAEVLEAGADDYVTKPVDVGVLNIRLAMAERSVADRGKAIQAIDQADLGAEHVRLLLDRLSEVVFSLELPGPRLTRVSAAVEPVLGVTPDRLLADEASWPPLLMPEGWESMSRALEAAGPGEVCRLSYAVTRPDGEVRWAESRLAAVRSPDGALIGVDGVLSDVSRALESRRLLAEQKEELETLYRASAALLGAPDPRSAVAAILPQLCQATGMPLGYAGLLDAAGDHLRMLSTVAPGAVSPVPESLPLEGTGAGLAVAANQLVAVDVATPLDGVDPGVYARLGIGAEIVAPLRVDGRVVGVLGLAGREPGRPEDRAIRLSRGVAAQISVFLARAGAPDGNGALDRNGASVEAGGGDPPVAPKASEQPQPAPVEPEQTESAGKVPPSLQPVNLKDVVQRSLDRLADRLTERNVRVSVEPGLPTVHAHPKILVDVFSILISDAVKGVPADRRPEIKIRWETPPEAVRIMVEDNGRNGSGHPVEGSSAPDPSSGEAGAGRRMELVQAEMEKLWGRAGLEPCADGGSRSWLEFPAIGD